MKKTPNILIVDDKVENLVALEAILDGFDVNFIRANSGNRALEISLNEESIALIIIDVQMPDMDGYETVTYLKQLKKTRDIPVIFVSAVYSDDYHKIKGVESGGIDFITKPITPQILIGKVKIFLELYRQQTILYQKLKNSEEITKNIYISKQRYELIFEQSPIAMWYTDGTPFYREVLDLVEKGVDDFDNYFSEEPSRVGEIAKSMFPKKMNKAVFKLFEVNSETALMKSLSNEVNKSFYQSINKQVKAVINGETSFSCETVIHTLDGIRKDVIIAWTADSTPEEKYSRVLVSLTDITKQKRDEAALKEANIKAEMAAEAKTSFLTSMSHEIRTPMNAVIGMVDLLAETDLCNEQMEYVSAIKSRGGELVSILSDILDLSKIGSGKIKIEKKEFKLRTCIEEAIDPLKQNIAEKDLEVIYYIEQDIPHYLIGDSALLKQVISNLLSNAIKFTEEGIIFIHVNRIETLKGIISLKFSVEDSGIGLSFEDSKSIFKAFPLQNSRYSKGINGAGLGLAICKSLVGLLNGTIWVDSELGKGSVFSFIVDVEVSSSNHTDIIDKRFPVLMGKKVLFVSDRNCFSHYLKKELDVWGLKAHIADDIDEARLLLKRESLFDFVIIDMQLKDLGGYHLSVRIREQYTETELPIVLISQPKGRVIYNKNRSIFNGYVSKPIKQAQLYQTILDVFHKDTINSEVIEKKRQIDSELAKKIPIAILVAEDQLINQKLLLRLLKRMGFTADLAKNGSEVLTAFDKKTYDLILMDIQMPVMDGLEATRQLKQLNSIYCPKIIAVTANAMIGDREICIEAGMDDYVTKPIDFVILQKAITKWGTLALKGRL
ncbi:MAG: hypothetical protein B6226_01645 [Candidatus Cloacimonetes bacterium 4572_65]|nr:MAG: hypothetical protein B6226_01645 [Candidatus Cloacimonetes bacterium 4572_65]